MAAFSSLTDRLSNAFKHLKSKGKLSEADIDGTIREIRRALLDADVALDVVRSFTSRIRERALGTEVSEALNPAQQVVKDRQRGTHRGAWRRCGPPVELRKESADDHHARRPSGRR